MFNDNVLEYLRNKQVGCRMANSGRTFLDPFLHNE